MSRSRLLGSRSRQARHLARADNRDRTALDPAQQLRGEIGAYCHVCIGRLSERGLSSYSSSRSGRRLKERPECRAGGILSFCDEESLFDLPADLGLADNHRVQPRCNGGEVIGGVVLPMGVERLGERLCVEPARLQHQFLEGSKPPVI